MKSQIKAIISDADGTLVDTLYLIRHGQYEAVAQLLRNFGVNRNNIPKYEVYESYLNKSVGGTTRETFEKTLRLMFSGTYEQILRKIDFEKLDKSLSPIQDHLAMLYVHPFHGLTELFSWCGKNNVKFGIITSGTRRHIIRNFGVCLPVMGYEELYLAEDIEIDQRFQAFKNRAKAVYGLTDFEIITSEHVSKTKPDPEGVNKLMGLLKVKPSKTLAMGDHPFDMQAAENAGIKTIVGISHGFGSVADLKEAGATKVIDNLTSVRGVIKHLK